MGILTTGDLGGYNARQEVNMRFIVVQNTESQINEFAAEYGGEVLADIEARQADLVYKIVKFEDEQAGQAFSVRMNGTTHRAEHAARRFLRAQAQRPA